jgi:flagellar motility protein MotE (MotC chaperone)
MRFRLLPVLILAGAMVLTVRAGRMWQEASYEAGALALAEATSPEAGETSPAAAPSAAPIESAATPGADAAAPAVAGAAPANPASDVNPFAYSDAEIELLQSLAERRAQLEKRESGLAEREALIAAAEKRVDEKLAELKQLQASIEAALGEQQATDDQMASLVKIYETMKPKDAARIFDKLDFPVLVEVVSRMREMKSAPVLAAMDPEKANKLTVALAARRDQEAALPTGVGPTFGAVPPPPPAPPAQ